MMGLALVSGCASPSFPARSPEPVFPPMPQVPASIPQAPISHAVEIPIRIPPWQNVPDGTLAVERSTNLVVWTQILSFTVPSKREDESVVWLEYPETIHWTEEHGQSKVFYRLRPLP